MPTPLGNLEDITLRALRVLRSVDWIAAEDTRRARVLLEAHDIRTPTLPHHAHNEHASAPALVAKLAQGESGALVTDAGMPGISDPGYLLTRECYRSGIEVEVLPGPSVVTLALVRSGFPIEPFTFYGYLPVPKGRRKRRLEEMRDEGRTSVVFETPHRVVDTLELALEVAPERPLALLRELTKLHEQRLVGTPDVVRAGLKEPVRGEIVLVFAPRGRHGEWVS